MDRRQFNKTVAAGIIGASFLPAADAKPVFNTLSAGKRGPLSAEELIGKATYQSLKPGEHIFGGLIDGKYPTAVFYYPHQPVWDWLYRLNHECVFPQWRSFRDFTTKHWYSCACRSPNDSPNYQTSAQKNWHKNAINLVWTDHWHFRLRTVHDKIPPTGTIFMWDNWNNFMSWVPNSHRNGENKPPCQAMVLFHDMTVVNEMPVHNGFISMCKGRPWKWNGNSIETFKTMPYPATIIRG